MNNKTKLQILTAFEKISNTVAKGTYRVYLGCLKNMLNGTAKVNSRSRFLQFSAVIKIVKRLGFELDFQLPPNFAKRGDSIKKTIVEKIVTNDKLQQLLSLLPTTEKGKQLALAIQIAVGSGLRLSEVLGLHPSDISIKQHFDLSSQQTYSFITFCVNGKGSKTRIACFNGDPSLLQNFKPFSISHHYVHRYFDRLHAKGFNFTFHSLRHTFATNQITKGTTIPILQKLLGHASIQTTSVYLHIMPQFDDLLKSGFGNVVATNSL